MEHTMIRVDKKLTESLKLLKEITGNSTYQGVLEELVANELLKHRALTSSGYVREGAIVCGRNTPPLVIKSITADTVTFHDNTYVFNGSKACYDLRLIEETLEDYEGKIDVEG